MEDDWYGHRDPLTGVPTGDRDEWISWDHILVNAYQLIQDFTNEHGLLIWEVGDPKERVTVLAERKIDKFKAAVESRTGGKKYKALKGEYFVPKLDLRAKEWPTFDEWVQSQTE